MRTMLKPIRGTSDLEIADYMTNALLRHVEDASIRSAVFSEMVRSYESLQVYPDAGVHFGAVSFGLTQIEGETGDYLVVLDRR